jgi:hypothetical protein
VEGRSKISCVNVWSGTQNFSLNLILEFLRLAEIVKVLTIIRSKQPKFTPSFRLLKEILIKAMSSLLLIHQTRTATLAMISKDKILTLSTTKNLFMFIKFIPAEVEPCSTIIDQDNVCTIWIQRKCSSWALQLRHALIKIAIESCYGHAMSVMILVAIA